VDRSGGEQPRISFDGRVLVVLNGEIYNHVELRRELEANGARFATSSDTEVLANGLAMWGTKIIRRIDGMYAFICIDLWTGDFVAARDPFGVKPLYLTQLPDGYLFCSEMKPLLELVEDADVLFLPPGYCMTSKGLFRYPAEQDPHPTRGIEDLDASLRAAVHSRIPPDLPLALMFSGGLDSTLIAHYAREMKPDLAAFFLGTRHAADYESAIDCADRMSLDLEVVDLEPDSMADTGALNDVVATVETFEPSVVRDAFCNMRLFQRIHERGYRVALSGEGADELFGGYKPIEVGYQLGEEAGNAIREQCIGLMARTNLQRLDRCGMHFLVEAREPYLNRTIVSHARSLTGRELMDTSNGRVSGKRPLKDVWRLYPDCLPDSVANRVKTPLHVGCGLDASQKESPLADLAEQRIRDGEFNDGKARYADFDLRTKEELLYLTMLDAVMDVRRVPHLKSRTNLYLPRQDCSDWAARQLEDFVVA